MNRTGLRWILTATAGVYSTLRVGRLCKVSYREGNWIQTFPSGTLVEPRLTLLTLSQIDALARDLWMFGYIPRKGDIVVDVGAGTGWETLVFSRQVGKPGRVVSIEAHPAVFSCLSQMRGTNQLNNVTLIHAAITSQECDVVIADGPDHLGNRIVGVNSGSTVIGTTLDQLLESLQLPRVDLLKMNIEGAEKSALAGMKEMIRNTRHVCISCHDFVADGGGPNEMRTKSDVVAFLEQNNFSIVLRTSDLRPFVRDYVYGVNRAFLNGHALTDRRDEPSASSVGFTAEPALDNHD